MNVGSEIRGVGSSGIEYIVDSPHSGTISCLLILLFALHFNILQKDGTLQLILDAVVKIAASSEHLEEYNLVSLMKCIVGRSRISG